jgi:hypothetical protein
MEARAGIASRSSAEAADDLAGIVRTYLIRA